MTTRPPKAVRAWAIVTPTGEMLLRWGTEGGRTPYLYADRKAALECCDYSDTAVQVEIKPVRKARGSKR